MFNIHIHTFLEKDIPRNFLPFGMVRLLNSKVGFFLFSKLLRAANPFSSKDMFDRYCRFVEIGKHKSQAEILNDCAEFYPCGTKFVILPMDMAYMGAGKVPRRYKDQLTELVRLMLTNQNVIPFIHIDPRREDYYDLFNYAIAEGFGGVKLYPPLGVFPFDARLDCIYDYCQSHKLPVLAHCTAGNPVHFKGSRKELKELLKPCKMEIDWSLSNKDLCSYFTHPNNYMYVFQKFPNLKICLAHFGRENDWDKKILSMMPFFNGLFVDISYSLYDQEHWGYLKVLLSTNPIFKERCLFGSDYYMNACEGEEKQFSINLRAYLGEDLWNQISVINPEKYLYK
jgi:uncharacterized protein